MEKQCGASIGKSGRALFVSPESPCPAVGGGAMRSAALLEYLRQRFDVEVVTFADGVEGAKRIELPYHSRSAGAKAWRNSRRFVLGRPPLVDRYSGFRRELRERNAFRTWPCSLLVWLRRRVVRYCPGRSSQ